MDKPININENGQQSIPIDQKITDKVIINTISTKMWVFIFILGTTGQLAWAVENTWFNTFVYDVITKDPMPIAWMVAVSAVVATITTLVMGTWSDRLRSNKGRRKPFIFYGYILWGFATAIFPTAGYIKDVGIAIIMVVLIDAIMTFFGSTANDAAFNAWVTDISNPTNRPKLQTLLQVCVLVANVIALGAAGFIIDKWGYYWFFYLLGGIVSLIGLLTGKLIEEPQIPKEEDEHLKLSFFEDLMKTFSWSVVRENKDLFLLLLNMGLMGISSQVYMPYLFIYIEHNLGYSKTNMSLLGGLILLVALIFAGIFTALAPRLNRWTVMVALPIYGLIVGISLLYVNNIYVMVVLLGGMFMITIVNAIILNAWLQDLYPEDARGKFQGVRLFFMVAIPMVIGPMIGAWVIKRWGTPTLLNGIPGYIPPTEIFLWGGIVALFGIIPLLFLSKDQKSLKVVPKKLSDQS